MKEFDAAAYTITVKRVIDDGVACFYSRVAEIPGISSWCDTYEEAYEQAIEALEVLHEAAIEDGKVFPAPFSADTTPNFSGRVTLRMSRSLHADVTHFAEEDGVSLNQWIIEAISQRRGFYISEKSTSGVLVNLATSIMPILHQAFGVSGFGEFIQASSNDRLPYRVVNSSAATAN